MNTPMNRPRRWRRRSRGAVSEIIGAVLLVGLTLTAGIILWSFRIYTPPAPPLVSFHLGSGGSNPVWGDPTDCQPQGNWTYPLQSSQYAWWTPGTWGYAWFNQCYPPNVNGNFSQLNTSEIIISHASPTNIPLNDIGFDFVCNNASSSGGTTVLVSGTLASMTWFPGSSSSPAPNAPKLGHCGNFNAGGYGGGAFGTLYNRLGMFIPIDGNSSVLEAGDTFLLYIHNGGWPMDYQCVDPDLYGCFLNHGNPILDDDDYHGAPPWCFTTPSACTIYLTYLGTPQTLLATIPVYSLAPPTGP